MKPCLSSSPVPAYPPVPRFVRCFPPRKAVLTVNGKTPDEFGNVVIVVADIGDIGDILDHINNANNPHGTTAAQVGTYTAAEIDDKIGRSEAHYLTADAAGNAFATAAALKSATAFYYAGQLHTPDKNDYLTVLSDEDHPTAAGLNPTTRYAFVGIYAQGGHFVYQYTINDNSLTNAQLAAVNSGIDADKVAKIAQNESDILAEIYRATHEEARLQGAINEIKTFEVVVADSLPDPSEQYRKKLYLIPSTNPETRNVKDEFICIEHDSVWSWEQVGSTSIDLTDYVKKPTADAPAVVLDTENGCLLEVGTRNLDAGGSLKVGNMSGGVIEVGSNEGGTLASIKKNGKEVATEEYVTGSFSSNEFKVAVESIFDNGETEAF